MKKIICLALCAILLAGCTAGKPAVTEPPQTESTTEVFVPEITEIDRLMEEMTLREKVGQLFIVRPDALVPGLDQTQIDSIDAPGVTELTEEMRAYLAEYPVGGVVMFAKNLTDPAQITAFNAALQGASRITLFIAVDEEGGRVARLANSPGFDLPKFESAAAVGASGDPEDALAMGRTIGDYLAAYGFNLDFAPVADVNTNPDNPVIGTRAFSSDAETAASMASAMAEGLNSRGIAAAYKHFPGHGDTAEDSHSGIAVTYKTKGEMLEREWLTFREAGDGDFVMVGHIAAPEITGDLTPASMSYTLVTEILKGELGFEGLVITDSLAMGAVTELYTPGEAAVTALQAGCDILLMPADLEEAFEAVLTALEDGTLTEEWLDETVRRILEFKQTQGILGVQNAE